MRQEEKAAATIEQYARNIKGFLHWQNGRAADKNTALVYKAYLSGKYAPATVNSHISALNGFFAFLEMQEMRIKTVTVQKRLFCGERELTKAEYVRLLRAARERKNERLTLMMQTICSTGIRVSELQFITAEAVRRECAEVRLKGKVRTIFLPRQMCKLLNRYIRKQGILGGSVFVTSGGKPLDRSNIWAEMKKLCAAAGVEPCKVFPHNLRHLFARTYYSRERDIVRLADILGHSSIETTRIYTMESGEVHRRQIQRLGLIMRC